MFTALKYFFGIEFRRLVLRWPLPLELVQSYVAEKLLPLPQESVSSRRPMYPASIPVAQVSGGSPRHASLDECQRHLECLAVQWQAAEAPLVPSLPLDSDESSFLSTLRIGPPYLNSRRKFKFGKALIMLVLLYVFFIGSPYHLAHGLFQGFHCGWQSRVHDIWRCE